ncbi:MAG: hypothetical protein RBS57_02295 [Desulforhabdus sp.]|nr:hypothetical protein [Desulforhabdus sp.]
MAYLYINSGQRINYTIGDKASQPGIPHAEMIADFAGGTKSMSARVLLASTEVNKEIQYMKPRRHNSDGRANSAIGSDPVNIDINFFLEFAQGQCLHRKG